MKKLFVLLIINNINVFSQTPLVLDISINDEIWLDGKITLYNGWAPNIRMIVMENYIVGISENNFPEELKYYLLNGYIKGTFKLVLLLKTNIPYYDIELMVFKIIEYNNIEILEIN